MEISVYFPPIRRSPLKNLLYKLLITAWLLGTAYVRLCLENVGRGSVVFSQYLMQWEDGTGVLTILESAGMEAAPFSFLGLLYPLVHGGRCQNKTMLFAGLSAAAFELLQYALHCGQMACDTVWVCILAAFCGYHLFLVICKCMPRGYRYLRTFDNLHNCTWLLVLILLSGVFYYCSTPDGQIVLAKEMENVRKAAESVADGSAFSNLGDGQKSLEEDVYKRLYKDLSSGKKTVTINLPMSIEKHFLSTQYSKVVWEHPELFWLSGGAKIRGIGSAGQYRYTITSEFAEGVSDLEEMMDDFSQIADVLTAEAKKLSTDAEKVRFIHDYLIEHTQYDLQTFFRPDRVYSISHTAYGCLVKHQAVCSGYAKAFQLLMNRLDIPCGTIRGTASNSLGSGGHAWNYVCIDGVYSYVDVTWDDPVSLTGKEGVLSHEYFCVSAEKMAENHFPDEDQKIPEALLIQ